MQIQFQINNKKQHFLTSDSTFFHIRQVNINKDKAVFEAMLCIYHLTKGHVYQVVVKFSIAHHFY